jgi:T-complex protein 1 subunit zeta
MTPDCLGEAGKVYEVSLGDDKFTFVEDVKFPKSCTILVKGPNEHTIAQLKDAVRDGMRAVVNAIEDAGAVPGAGAFELAAADALTEYASTGVQGKAKLGVLAFAEALLVIPKTLAVNAAQDATDLVAKLCAFHHAAQTSADKADMRFFGLDLVNGKVRGGMGAARSARARARARALRGCGGVRSRARVSRQLMSIPFIRLVFFSRADSARR